MVYQPRYILIFFTLSPVVNGLPTYVYFNLCIKLLRFKGNNFFLTNVLTYFKFVRQRLVIDDVHGPLGRHDLLHRVDVDEAAVVCDRARVRTSSEVVRLLDVGAVVEVDQNACSEKKINYKFDFWGGSVTKRLLTR